MIVSINNNSLFFETAGDSNNPALIFIHGFPFNHHIWDEQVDVLKEKFYVIVYDVRGHGQSEVGDGQYSIELFVDDLIGLLDYLKIKKIIIAGLSMGGYIALRAVQRNPERFNGLVLASTRSESDTNEAKLKRFKSITLLKKEGGLIAFCEPFLKTAFSESTLKNHPEVVDRLRKIILKNTSLGIVGTLLALASRTDTSEILSQITIPALIMAGKEDVTIPSSVSVAMHEKIAKSKLEIFSNAGHMINMEFSDLFNQKIQSWWNHSK